MITIGPLRLHRKEQWDLDCYPWLCAHWRYDHGNGSRRVFCLWTGGVQIGAFSLTRRAVRVGRRIYRWRGGV